MRFAARLVAFLVLTLAAVIALDGYLEYVRERALMLESESRDSGVLGKAISGMLADVWAANGMDRALGLIADMNEPPSDVLVRWVWLDAKPGEPLAPEASSRAEVRRSLQTGELVESEAEGERRFYSYFPVLTGEARDGAVEISQSADALSHRAARILRRSATQLIVLFLMAALTISFLGARLVGRPLKRLVAKIDRVGRGDLSGPVSLRGKDELTELADGLNTMCERLSLSQAKLAEETDAKIAAIEQARHADRLRTVGRMASGVAHELGTPLNVVGGRAALIAEEKLEGPQVKESAEIIIGQVDRMTGIIRQLLVFARQGSTARQRVDVEQAVRQNLAIVEPAAKKHRVTVALLPPATHEVFAECSPSALQQVLTNLILNAIQASAEGSTVQVAIGTGPAAPPDDPDAERRPCVRVEVRDTGGGIPDDALPHIFEPFFTTKDVGEGTGLGLSIVHGILRDHGGWITVASAPAEGSAFTFYLPASAT